MAARKKTAKKTTRKSTTARKKTTAKRATVRKSAARKTTKKKKATAKRAPTRRTTAKRSTATKTTVKAGPVSVGKKPFTKSQIIGTVAEQTGMGKKEIAQVFDAISSVINAHVSKKGPGMFSMPGMFKILVVKKPAVAARWGVNPFTGEKMKFKAKPASRRVKIRPLKALKEMAA